MLFSKSIATISNEPFTIRLSDASDYYTFEKDVVIFMLNVLLWDWIVFLVTYLFLTHEKYLFTLYKCLLFLCFILITEIWCTQLRNLDPTSTNINRLLKHILLVIDTNGKDYFKI